LFALAQHLPLLLLLLLLLRLSLLLHIGALPPVVAATHRRTAG
jgi:hypothetical protein